MFPRTRKVVGHVALPYDENLRPSPFLASTEALSKKHALLCRGRRFQARNRKGLITHAEEAGDLLSLLIASSLNAYGAFSRLSWTCWFLL